MNFKVKSRVAFALGLRKQLHTRLELPGFVDRIGPREPHVRFGVEVFGVDGVFSHEEIVPLAGAIAMLIYSSSFSCTRNRRNSFPPMGWLHGPWLGGAPALQSGADKMSYSK